MHLYPVMIPKDACECFPMLSLSRVSAVRKTCVGEEVGPSLYEQRDCEIVETSTRNIEHSSSDN